MPSGAKAFTNISWSVNFSQAGNAFHFSRKSVYSSSSSSLLPAQHVTAEWRPSFPESIAITTPLSINMPSHHLSWSVNFSQAGNTFNSSRESFHSSSVHGSSSLIPTQNVTIQWRPPKWRCQMNLTSLLSNTNHPSQISFAATKIISDMTESKIEPNFL